MCCRFIQNIKCENLPGFPIWSDCLCPIEENPYFLEMETLPKWQLNFILKNNEQKNLNYFVKLVQSIKLTPIFHYGNIKLTVNAFI